MMPRSLEIADYCRVELVTAYAPLRQSDLTEGELALWNDVRGDQRKITWLRGRRALRDLRVKQGGDVDTATLSFPSPRLSVSHSRELSLAAGVKGAVQGLGLDVELDRGPGTAFARFFMTDDEIKCIRGLREHTAAQRVLGFWTIKEALFKATPDNTGLGLRHFRLSNPDADEGEASLVSRPGLRLCYTTMPLERGQVSVAIARRPERGDD